MTRSYSLRVFCFAIIGLAAQCVVSHAEMTAAQACSFAKVKASVAAFRCIVRQTGKLLLSGSADLPRCETKLNSAFVAAESDGACPTTGDAASAQARLESIEERILLALGSDDAGTLAEKRCVVAENGLLATYASCQARTLRARTEHGGNTRFGFLDCVSKFIERFEQLETDGGCHTLADTDVLRRTSNAVHSYLPGADIAHGNYVAGEFDGANFIAADISFADFQFGTMVGADLTDADATWAYFRDVNLEGANFSGTNLENAGFTGAHLDDVVWDSTVCPDGTNSDDHAATCCGHFRPMDVASSCSP